MVGWKLVVVVEWKRVCWIGSGLDELDDQKKLGWRVVRWMFLYLLDESLWLVAFSLVLSLLCLVSVGVVVRAVILCYCMGESVMAMSILS
jgi:hypothetical protein